MADTAGKANVGLVGLAVMGENLALNIADHGFKVAVYNRTTETMKQFVAENPRHARRAGRLRDARRTSSRRSSSRARSSSWSRRAAPSTR